VTIDLSAASIDLLEQYETAVLPLIEKHGGRLEMRVRAVDQSKEAHLVHFPDAETYQAFATDPERLSVQHIWDASGATSVVADVEDVS